ncbi:MAG: hypothetical protein ABW133_21295 [Polyangiaceae bacterium]
MFLGFLLFCFLNAAAIVAGASVGVRARWDSRAELSVGVFIVWHAIVSFTTLGLGWLNLLYRPTLAISILAVSALTFLGTSLGRPIAEHARETFAALGGLARLPYDAFVLAAGRRSFAALAILVTIPVIAYATWLAYLAPPTGWDGLWYHDTIVGYAIQNHGFRWLELPHTLDYVNTFPRVCEMMNLWFVYFTDRRFLDMVGSAMTPALVASVYVLVRRFESSALRALSWSLAFLWVPGVLLQLNSTYIDTHIATIHIAAIAFAMRPKLRLVDGILAGLAFGLLVGTKGHALTWIPFSGSVAFCRLFWQNFRTKKLATVGVGLFGVACILYVAAPTYVRNWIHYKNPIYPVDFASRSLGIHFPGHQRLEDIQRPVMQVIGGLYTFHQPGSDFFDIGNHGYGYGIPWVAMPLAALAFAFAVYKSVFARVAGIPSPRTDNLILTSIPVLITGPLSPALWSARYNLHVAAVIIVLAAWATSGRGLRLFGDVPAGACLVVSFIFIYFAIPPAFAIPIEDAKRLATLGPVERASYEWVYHWGLHDFQLHRETDLRPHDVVAYTDSYLFPAYLWNERYENEILYLPFTGGPEFMKSLDDAKVKWVMTHAGRTGFGELSASPAWEEMGPITRNTERWTWFRRRAPQP